MWSKSNADCARVLLRVISKSSNNIIAYVCYYCVHVMYVYIRKYIAIFNSITRTESCGTASNNSVAWIGLSD